MDTQQQLIIIALIILVSFMIFLIMREVMCWYWKINKILDVLNEINDNLKDKKTKELTSSDYF